MVVSCGLNKAVGCVDRVSWSIAEEVEGVLPVDKSGWLMSQVMKPENGV